ncbi:MAG: HNH endonuclease [Deltaproteobacteria bacterium]|nr:HNH endonuclease [Deltaproteobacteria bacterium]
MLDSRVLVLNRLFQPINVITLRRAIVMFYQGLARAVTPEYETFDFDSWTALSVAVHEEQIGLVNGGIRVPRVILVRQCDWVPRRHVKFNRASIFARDRNRCQYCGKNFPRSELNLDHVVPRSQGGRTTWENIVCSCIQCNRVKGGNTPDQAGMRLVREPFKPAWSPIANLPVSVGIHRDWTPFLVSTAYWNVELQQD